jgi:hypothetical protein
LTFDWSSSEAVGLAKEGCTHCLGIGLRRGGRVKEVPCGCVLRKIFRVCYQKFRACALKEKHVGKVRLDPMTGTDGSYCWGMKDEEYMADFCLVSRRSLDDFEYQIFKFHFLLGADWKLCSRRLNIDRGSFFHQLYRIEEKLGRVYRELRPHALYPLDEYFGGTVRRRLPQREVTVVQMPLARPAPMTIKGRALRPPLKKVA